MRVIYQWVRDTKNYGVWEEVGGFNKLYLPLSFGYGKVEITVAPVV